MYCYPARIVAVGDHLALPQQGQFGFPVVRRDAIGDAAAGPAAVQRQHQPRIFRRAALKPDWLICKLTEEGRRFARKK